MAPATVKRYPTAPNKGLPVALSRTLTVTPITKLGFQECHSFTKALHLSEERMLTVMPGGALPVRKGTKTEALGGPLSPGILNFVSACNEKNSTRICSRPGRHP